MNPVIVTLVSDTTLITIASSVFGVIVSGLVGWLIARQNRAASKDVAREEAHATVESSQAEAEKDAYTRARTSLEGVIAQLERENVRVRETAERCATDALTAAEKASAQAVQIEGLERDVQHLRNQDSAKQRIIDRMVGELREAKAALALRYPDE